MILIFSGKNEKEFKKAVQASIETESLEPI
jgi:hypothetical protein